MKPVVDTRKKNMEDMIYELHKIFKALHIAVRNNIDHHFNMILNGRDGIGCIAF